MVHTAEQLAEELVNKLFSLGEPWAPITRVQLMAGDWNSGNETGQGGFGKQPLINLFTETLKQSGV